MTLLLSRDTQPPFCEQDERPCLTLTPAETRVIELVKQGLTNREIGEQFGVSTKAIELHMHNILLKFGARNRTEAVVLWMQASRDEA